MPDYNMMKNKICCLKKKIVSIIFAFIFVLPFIYSEDFYWENPISITNTNTQFPKTLTNNNETYVFWQEIDEKEKNIYLTCRTYFSQDNYTDTKRFAGPFSYSAEIPDLYSLTLLKNGTIAVAALSDSYEISIYLSQNSGKTFTQTKIKTKEIMVAPRIYATNRDSLVLFTSSGNEDSFNILYSESKDGTEWSNFNVFEPSVSLRNPFIPYLLPLPESSTVKGDVVVFQAQYLDPATNRFSFQLYQTYYDESTKKWSPAKLITTDNSLSDGENKAFTNYQNQSPVLYNYKNKTYLLWERTANVNSILKIAELDLNGIITKTTQNIADQGSASRGIFFTYNDNLCVVWFDTRRGKESVYMAEKSGSYWDEKSLVENKYSNLFAYPVLVKDIQNNKEILSFIWQQKTDSAKNTIEMLFPDKTVSIPTFTALSYKNGKRSSSQNVKIQINFPDDSSNIAGYSYTWTKDAPGNPPRSIQHFTKEKQITVKAEKDGVYYLTARVQDYAGNWSEVNSISYHYDITPPSAPNIQFTNLDDYGFINSNTYTLSWLPGLEEDINGYVYRIDYIGDIPKSVAVSKKHPLKISPAEAAKIVEDLTEKYQKAAQKDRKMDVKNITKNTKTTQYYNRENGVYVFTVCAVDEVGNISEPQRKIFILNKYEPSTYISSVSLKNDDSGNNILTIRGGGFTYDGTISAIYIDADGKAPYDLVLEKSQNKYKVQSDTLLNNVNIGSDLDEGSYRIGLLHSDRGLYMSGKILKIDQSGTLKIEGSYVFKNQYSQTFKTYKYKFIVNLFVAVLLVLIIGGIFIFAVLHYTASGYESTVIGKKARALLKGDYMPEEKSTKKGSLKGILILFTSVLIVLVVVSVTIVNSVKLVNLQKNTMASGLQNRAEVLLESLASGVKNFFPSNNILELSALPGQKDAMTEVKYVTILGQPQESTSSENLNYVWATNDEDITEKIDTYTFSYGESQITDPVILTITKKFQEFDNEIKSQITPLNDKISELNDQLVQISESDNEERDSLLESVSGAQAEVRNQLDTKLQELAKQGSGSYPQFDANNLDETTTQYIFYRPVTYRSGNSGNYVHGVVYIEVSTQELLNSLVVERNKSIWSGVVSALVAVIIGIVGALLFATIIIKPIRKLESHVIKIGQTRKKKDIKDIKLKSKDEIGRLGDAINKMTDELKENEIENNLLIDGADVQNSLTPLEKGETFSNYSDDFINASAYFQAQTGVSGDYFDFHQLEGDWYCYIKSDASGHGAPAALISTCVAVLYREYFSNWSYKKNGTNINVLVERINDFISNWHLRGKFSTLLIGIYNKKTGDTWMCNAGDNLVHIYRKNTGKVQVVQLKETPTAGPFDTFMVNMKGGFIVEKEHLNPGDVLFLYTDGIEEAWRRVRFEDYSVKKYEVKDTKKNPETGKIEEITKLEDEKEEFGPERVMQVIEAFFHKQKFVLDKKDNPDKTEVLEFDYSKVEQNLYGVIFALASAEKVFRFYKPKNLVDSEYIEIDKNIDGFLEKCFNSYSVYSEKKQVIQDKPNFIEYPALKEDEQGDDLTLLAIERK